MRTIDFPIAPPAIIHPGEWSEIEDHAWDINRANLLLRFALGRGSWRRIQMLKLDEAQRSSILQRGENVRLDPQLPPIDPHIPILLVRITGRLFILDGYQRALVAIAQKWDRIPAYTLTGYEEWTCRICPCCRPSSRLSQLVREAREGRALQAC